MRKFCLLLPAFCFLLLSSSAQPAMKLSQLEHNFGRIDPKADPVSHTFEIHNTGDQPLVILRVDTACRCTTATYSKRPIAPGASSQIVITYNPKGQKETFLKAIQIFTNEPTKRQIISIQGNVK